MKNFDSWNTKKQELENNILKCLPIKEREIWWSSVGLNIGDEEDGKGSFFERPVLILKKFNNKVSWILPLSSKPGNSKYYLKILYQGNESYVILSQIKLMSVKRLNRIMGQLSRNQFDVVRRRIIEFLE